MQPKKKLSDFQATLKELQKIGAFSEEDLDFLGNLDQSMEEITKEVADSSKLQIEFKNDSGGPDPVMDGNVLRLRSPVSVQLEPLEPVTIPVKIKLFLPDNLVFILRTNRHLLMLGAVASDYRFVETEICLSIINFNKESIRIPSGEEIADLIFVYSIPSGTVELKKVEN